MFAVKASVYENEGLGGKFTLIESSLPLKEAGDLLSESKSIRPKPTIKIALDVSGSMQMSMQQVLATALASVDALDDGSKLSIITFDDSVRRIKFFDEGKECEEITLTNKNRIYIKQSIERQVQNVNGGTRLELPLSIALETPCSLMFVTDGCATSGFNISSKDLLAMVRSISSYKHSTINCLGLQLDESCTMNGELLKQMALDTNGTSLLARNAEGLGSFMGNVLYNHYMRRFDRVQIMGTSSNGLKGNLVNAPLHGYVINADKPTYAIMQWPLGAIEPYSIFVHAMPADEQQGFAQSSVQCTSSANKCNEKDEERIIGFLASTYLSPWTQYPSDQCLAAFSSAALVYPKLIPVISALKAKPKNNQQDIYDAKPNVTQMAFKYSSMGGEDLTPTLEYMREQSAALTLAATQEC